MLIHARNAEQARMTAPGRFDELVFLPLGGAGEIGMNFNAYGFGPPDARKWIVVDCGVLFGREGRHARRRCHHAGHRASWPNRRERCARHRRSPMRTRIISARCAYLWPQLRCPIYATPFTA